MCLLCCSFVCCTKCQLLWQFLRTRPSMPHPSEKNQAYATLRKTIVDAVHEAVKDEFGEQKKMACLIKIFLNQCRMCKRCVKHNENKKIAAGDSNSAGHSDYEPIDGAPQKIDNLLKVKRQGTTATGDDTSAETSAADATFVHADADDVQSTKKAEENTAPEIDRNKRSNRDVSFAAIGHVCKRGDDHKSYNNDLHRITLRFCDSCQRNTQVVLCTLDKTKKSLSKFPSKSLKMNANIRRCHVYKLQNSECRKPCDNKCKTCKVVPYEEFDPVPLRNRKRKCFTCHACKKQLPEIDFTSTILRNAKHSHRKRVCRKCQSNGFSPRDCTQYECRGNHKCGHLLLAPRELHNVKRRKHDKKVWCSRCKPQTTLENDTTRKTLPREKLHSKDARMCTRQQIISKDTCQI